eukprot:TRINITY_DN19254_c1_g1_i1.p3 TRINITY_DN19254_c1_g1~~TRINITY_DN19254_c1_g1_i1.p3  ORF type:complete len:115 (-),score=11.94 TRINITY_DN19254_c1_g1_i1:59-403(-)
MGHSDPSDLLAHNLAVADQRTWQGVQFLANITAGSCYREWANLSLCRTSSQQQQQDEDKVLNQSNFRQSKFRLPDQDQVHRFQEAVQCPKQNSFHHDQVRLLSWDPEHESRKCS